MVVVGAYRCTPLRVKIDVLKQLEAAMQDLENIENPFMEDWRDCLRAHYIHVVKEQDTVNEGSLITVLRDTGFEDEDGPRFEPLGFTARLHQPRFDRWRLEGCRAPGGNASSAQGVPRPVVLHTRLRNKSARVVGRVPLSAVNCSIAAMTFSMVAQVWRCCG